MKIGMLWFDNDPKTTLAAKIERAAAYYRQKHGEQPNTVYVNPSDLCDCQVEGVAVKAAREVLPCHLWVGVEEA